MIKLKVRWLKVQLPFLWNWPEDFLEVGDDASIEDLAAAVSVAFHRKAMEFRGDLEYEFQVQLISVCRSRVPGDKGFAFALPYGDRVDAHFKAEAVGEDGEVIVDEMYVEGRCVPKDPKRATLEEDDKIPVVLLSGFLGSGKTTLLNYILSGQRDKKIAVLENEFGEIPIDAELINQKYDLAEQVVVMDNGCMCCTMRGDLVDALASIQKKVAQGNPLDLVLVETTGMADPVPIVMSFKQSPWITERMRYAGCITVVDAKNCLERLDLEIEDGAVNEAVKQISFADKIILNKVDLVDIEEARSVQAKIRDLNQFVRTLPAVRGQVNLEELLDLPARDEDLLMDAMEEPVKPPVVGLDGGLFFQSPVHRKPAVNHHKRHDTRVNSVGIEQEGSMPRSGFQNFFMLLRHMSVYDKRCVLFRIKGIFSYQGEQQKSAFHGVMHTYSNEVIGHWGPDERRCCKLVLIGLNIDGDLMRRAFKDAMADQLRVSYSNCLGVSVKFQGEPEPGPGDCKHQ